MVDTSPLSVADNLYWIPGENGARFPYCHTYLFDAGEGIIAFDPQCGRSRLQKALAGIGHEIKDITEIVCTHFHLDHSASNVVLREETGAGIWIHELDAPALHSLGTFAERYGIEDAGLRTQWREYLVSFGVSPHDPDHVLHDGDAVPGGFQTIFTPGHSPGHCCFLKDSVLIAGDIDCTTPWVGNASSNVGDFLASIERLQSIDLSTLLPGHGAPILENIPAALEAFRQKMLHREAHLLEILSAGPLTLDELVQRVDQMKQERIAGAASGDLPVRSPFSSHFARVSMRNYLLHLQALSQVEVTVVDDCERWGLR